MGVLIISPARQPDIPVDAEGVTTKLFPSSTRSTWRSQQQMAELPSLSTGFAHLKTGNQKEDPMVSEPQHGI